MRRILIGVALLLGTTPLADARAADLGTVESVRELRAGFLEDAPRGSQQCSLVRSGAERPALPGEVIHEGDALRTSTCAVAVAGANGEVYAVGQSSQVWLGAAVIHRLGEALYTLPGQRALTVGDVEFAAQDARVHVVWRSGGGSVSVLAGALDGPTGSLEKGQLLSWGPERTFAVAPLGEAPRAAVEAWATQTFEASGPAGTRRDRVHIRAAGGFALLDRREWGQGGIEGRARLAGPAWLALGGHFLGRPGEADDPGPLTWAVPLWLGGRAIGDLPGIFYVGGGGDVVILVAERCVGLASCVPTVVVEPGGRGVLLGGMRLGRRLSFELEVAGGVLRRRTPSVANGGLPTAGADPTVSVSGGITLRL
jgi:hypothetical protein